MSGGAAPLREVRQLAASAAAAEDAALLRLVRLLDSLPERGEADRVLDSARPRLQALRPERPIGFARLLFLPLDGAIVAPQRWRRGGYEIPRSALPSIAAAVEASLGLAAAAVRRDADGQGLGDEALVAALGARLWPVAATALPAAAPAGWEASGLAPDDYGAIREVAAPVLAAGVAIHAALRAASAGPPQDLVRNALIGPAQAGPLPLAAAVATLLRRAAAPGAVLLAAAELGGGGRGVATRMVDAALEMLPDLATATLHDAAAQAARFFGAAQDLAGSGLLDPDRTRRLAGLRHAAEEACRHRVLEDGTNQVVRALATLNSTGVVADEAVVAVEREARAIRALAQVGRSVGDPAVHDRALRQLSDAVRAIGSGGGGAQGLTPIDLARVVEILVGPEAAAALLPRLHPS